MLSPLLSQGMRQNIAASSPVDLPRKQNKITVSIRTLILSRSEVAGYSPMFHFLVNDHRKWLAIRMKMARLKI